MQHKQVLLALYPVLGCHKSFKVQSSLTIDRKQCWQDPAPVLMMDHIDDDGDERFTVLEMLNSDALMDHLSDDDGDERFTVRELLLQSCQ